ncbi:hypothetical protein X274_10270 [Marinitoga sp. 1155]|nr:hypothetical protein X274_10270 [Marinitoga sp. 1155]
MIVALKMKKLLKKILETLRKMLQNNAIPLIITEDPVVSKVIMEII